MIERDPALQEFIDKMFPEEAQRIRERKCPFCGKKIEPGTEFKDELSKREFEIVFQSDIDFKALYGSTAEKVRKQHAKTELKELDKKIKGLEWSVVSQKEINLLERPCDCENCIIGCKKEGVNNRWEYGCICK